MHFWGANAFSLSRVSFLVVVFGINSTDKETLLKLSTLIDASLVKELLKFHVVGFPGLRVRNF